MSDSDPIDVHRSLQKAARELAFYADHGYETEYNNAIYRLEVKLKAVRGPSEPRLIATVAELDALPEDSVILDDGWYPKVKGENNKWWRPDCRRGIPAEGTVLPTRLLWIPEDD